MEKCTKSKYNKFVIKVIVSKWQKIIFLNGRIQNNEISKESNSNRSGICYGYVFSRMLQQAGRNICRSNRGRYYSSSNRGCYHSRRHNSSCRGRYHSRSRSRLCRCS